MKMFMGLLLLVMFPCVIHSAEEGVFLRGSTLEHQKPIDTKEVSSVERSQHELLQSVAKRMRPRNLQLPVKSSDSSTTPPKQFFHLHHMKSGGTSLSSWIRCGLSRLSSHISHEMNEKILIPSADLSECSWNSYHQCINNEHDTCRNRIDSAAVMTFCSPLAVTEYFNWTDTDAVTMMRDPVSRVWSMFRFQTKSCFKCTNLTQVYEDIDNGETEKYGGGVCLAQLQNHITRNLQKLIPLKDLDDPERMTDEEKVNDAVDSIRNRFAVVGVIERLDETIEQMSFTFPWLKEELDGAIDGLDKKCPFPHSNGSPTNNRCGPGGSHWDLPSQPDEATRAAIEKHNQLDRKVYEAALQQFELQMMAMKMQDEETILISTYKPPSVITREWQFLVVVDRSCTMLNVDLSLESRRECIRIHCTQNSKNMQKADSRVKSSKILASYDNNWEGISKAPTFNGQVILPIKAVLPGLKPHKVAAVYAIYSEYSRADKEGWGKVKHIDITKDLYSDLIQLKEKCYEVNFVKALSFAYPQKSAMKEVADRWIALMVENGGVPGLMLATFTVSVTKNKELVELMMETAGSAEDDSDDEFEIENESASDLFVDATKKKTLTKTVQGMQIKQDSVVSPFEVSTGENNDTPSYKMALESKLEFSLENVNKVLDEIRPYLISDGGNVSVRNVDQEKKNVYLVLEGACGSCSSSTVTMSMGITRVLRENFLGLGEVIQVDADTADSKGAEKATELTMEAVKAEINRIGPAITAMGGQVEILSIDPIGVVELRFRGANKVKQGLELALMDVKYVKHVKFVS